MYLAIDSKIKSIFLAGPVIKVSILNFVVIFAIANTALFHRHLLVYAANTYSSSFLDEAAALFTLFFIIAFITALFLSAIALFSPTLVKPVCILVLLGNAVALYFIESYNIILDRSMMGNAFGTQVREVSELIHPFLFAYIFIYAVLPSLAIWKICVIKARLLKRVLILSGIFVVGATWIFTNAKTWLWLDENGSQFGGLILPWSYIVNSFRWYNDQQIRESQEQILLPDAKFIESGDAVVVLIIGESARAKNFSLYGYDRETNPLLTKTNIVSLTGATSCTTYTTGSIECMLSHLGSDTSRTTPYEPLPSYLHRNGVKVVWRTDNWGEPELDIDRYEYARDIRAACKNYTCNFDEVLLQDLEVDLQHPGQNKTFVVLHQHGSHGPLYSENYPEAFSIYNPTCKSVVLANCSNSELINAYDNTIVYTDYFISRAIAVLSTLKEPAVLIYVSDHGESLGEYGLYLHGTPLAIAPDVQKEVPFLVWMSDEFRQSKGIDNDDLRVHENYSLDYIFHSVMGALGMTSDIYKSQFDIFNIE